MKRNDWTHFRYVVGEECTEKTCNEEVLWIVHEQRSLLKPIANLRGRLRHASFLRSIIRGNNEGKRGQRRPGQRYSDKVK